MGIQLGKTNPLHADRCWSCPFAEREVALVSFIALGWTSADNLPADRHDASSLHLILFSITHSPDAMATLLKKPAAAEYARRADAQRRRPTFWTSALAMIMLVAVAGSQACGVPAQQTDSGSAGQTAAGEESQLTDDEQESKRTLPQPGAGQPSTVQADAAEQAESPDEPAQIALPERPDQRAAKAFAPPPDTKRLTKNSRLWVDLQQKRIYIDGYVAMRRGPLEMFACPVGTKEHESIVAALAKSREVHAALLAVGATPGTPVSYDPEFIPPTGQQIRVWVCWYDEDGKFQVSDARRWLQKQGTQQSMQEDWVFAGSGFWQDPADGKEYYQADGGDMICVSNFSTAMMDVPFPSSAKAGQLLFVPFTERIPEQGSPVRLVLVPIPVPTDKPVTQPQPNPNEKPTAKILPKQTPNPDPIAPVGQQQ